MNLPIMIKRTLNNMIFCQWKRLNCELYVDIHHSNGSVRDFDHLKKFEVCDKV